MNELKMFNMKRQFNLDILKELFQSNEVEKELKALSSWARSVRQERQIINIIARFLDRNNYNFKMEFKKNNEKRKYDIEVENVLVEVKFTFEEDIKYKLEKEMYGEDKKPMHGDVVKQYLVWLNEREEQNKEKTEQNQRIKTWGYNLIALILIDIFKKECDYFILIVHSRDLRKVPFSYLEKIVDYKSCIRYNNEFKGHHFSKNFIFLDKLLESINKVRPFNSARVDIEGTNMFPYSYHIYILEFK